ncbi:MAG: sigma-E factor negative regulatory protein [Proteobacteria bacterium]|nr:sigma-E factor negative regulatory protein [Pseudomonadota bacterium]
MNDSDKLREQVSALVDGQLRDDEFARAVEHVCVQEELRGAWHTYHVVGEVIRSGRHAACQDSTAFMSRFRERLAAEGLRPAAAPSGVELQVPTGIKAEAANEPVFRWKLVAGIASVAAVAAIGWSIGASVLQGPPGGAQLAQQEQGNAAAPVLASSALPPVEPSTTTTTRVLLGDNQRPQVMLRDARLDALLEAHQEAGGASHMPSGFLRNATFEGQSR